MVSHEAVAESKLIAASLLNTNLAKANETEKCFLFKSPCGVIQHFNALDI